MESCRMSLCRFIALTFLGDYMDHNCFFNFSGFLDGPYKTHSVMSIYRSKISYTKVFKYHSGNEELFKTVLGSSDGIYHFGVTAKLCVHILFKVKIPLGSTYAVKIFAHSSDAFGNGHLVVV